MPTDYLHVQPRRLRTPAELRAALNALNTAQKTNLWTDLTADNPPRWATAAGPNTGALLVLHLLATGGTLSLIDVAEAKLRAAILYLMDHPTWLLRPVFDPSINVDGTAPLVA